MPVSARFMAGEVAFDGGLLEYCGSPISVSFNPCTVFKGFLLPSISDYLSNRLRHWRLGWRSSYGLDGPGIESRLEDTSIRLDQPLGPSTSFYSRVCGEIWAISAPPPCACIDASLADILYTMSINKRPPLSPVYLPFELRSIVLYFQNIESSTTFGYPICFIWLMH